MTRWYLQWGYDMSGIVLAFVGATFGGGAGVAVLDGTFAGAPFASTGFGG
jgi:cell division protein FtsX